jgi:hypothetical protein
VYFLFAVTCARRIFQLCSVYSARMCNHCSHHYTVRKVSGFPVPSRDVTYLTLPGRENDLRKKKTMKNYEKCTGTRFLVLSYFLLIVSMYTVISNLAGMSPYISLKIKKRHYEHHMTETHR